MNNEFSETNIYIINHWFKSNEKDVYIFVGNANVNEKNYKKEKNVRNQTFIKENIFSFNNIVELKTKIGFYCMKSIANNDIYCWCKTKLDEHNAKYFANEIYKDNLSLSSEYIKLICKIYFEKTFVFDTENKDYVFIDDFIEKIRNKLLNKSIDFNYENGNNRFSIFSPNPFESKYNEISDNSKKVLNTYKIISYFNCHDYEINFITKENTEYDIYFDKNKKISSKTIERKDELQKEFIKNDVEKQVLNELNYRIELLTFRVLPISHKLNLNLELLFNTIKTSVNVPMIMYKGKFTNEYKVNKVGLSKINASKIRQIQENELKYKDVIFNRSVTSLLFILKQEDDTYIYIVLSSNGSYKVQYKFFKTNDYQINEIKDKSFDNINDIIKQVSNDNIVLLNRDLDIFRSPFIEIIDFVTHNIVQTKKPHLDVKTIKDNFEKVPYMFDIISSTNNIIKLTFKEVNNLLYTDNISSFMYNNIELNSNSLIAKISTEFDLTLEEATTYYTENVNKLDVKISKKGTNIFVKREHDTIINVKIQILDDLSLRIHTTNTQNEDYLNNIIYYILNILFYKISKKQIKEEPNKEVQNADDLNFNDILKNMEDNDDSDSDLEDIGFDFSSSPVLNIEDDFTIKDTNITNDDIGSDNDDEDDGYKFKESGISTDYTTFVLEKLYKADKNLFVWKDDNNKMNKYSSKCQATDFRQPIVINEKEKKLIDENHPNSYDGYVQTGSTEALKKQNFYICPKIWCRISRTSITQEEYEKYGNKCPPPYNEEPLFFPKKGSKKNYFLTKDGTEKHYPKLLQPNKHPKSFRLPCCAKTKDKSLNESMTTNGKVSNQDSMYIHNISNKLVLNEGSYGNLPKLLNNILNKKDFCFGNIDKKTQCFVRTGVNNIEMNNSLLSVLEKILKINNIPQFIANNLLLEHYIFLNNGNTLKVFCNNQNAKNIFIKESFDKFKKVFLENTGYIKTLNLQEEKRYLQSLNVFPQNVNTELQMSIIREFMILDSFINFKSYILSEDIEKTVNDIYHMLTFEWLNKKKHNFLFLKIDGDNMYIQNSRYFKLQDIINKSKNTAIILQIQNSFEYVSFIEFKQKKIQSQEVFDYQSLSNLYKNIPKEEKKVNIVLTSDEIDHYVISTNFQCVGIVEAGNFIPTLKYLNLEYDDLKKKSIVYTDKVSKFGIDEKSLAKYNIKLNKNQLAQVISPEVPLLNLQLFTNQTLKESTSILEDKIYEIAKRIQNTPKLKESYNILTHELAIFNINEKRVLMKKIFSKHKLDIPTNILDDVIAKILKYPLMYLIDLYESSKLKLNDDELKITFDQMINGKLFDIHKDIRSIYRPIDTLIEDFIDIVDSYNIQPVILESSYKLEKKRISITPVKLAKLLPTFNVVDKKIELVDLLELANYVADKKNVDSLSIDDFIKEFRKSILKDISDKSLLLQKLEMNPSIKNIKLTTKSYDDEFSELLNTSNYYYSFYELEILSNILSINIGIIGRQTSYVQNGLTVIKPNSEVSEYYIFLHYVNEKDRHIFKLISNEKNDIILTVNNFEDDFNKLLKPYTI